MAIYEVRFREGAVQQPELLQFDPMKIAALLSKHASVHKLPTGVTPLAVPHSDASYAYKVTVFESGEGIIHRYIPMKKDRKDVLHLNEDGQGIKIISPDAALWGVLLAAFGKDSETYQMLHAVFRRLE